MELWDIIDENRNMTGEKIERGKPLTKDQFHLVVFAIILSEDGRLLVTKRTEEKTFPLHWEITGGAAVSGDDSETAVLREIFEEVGLKFNKGEGQLVTTFKNPSGFSYFGDIWLFQKKIDLTDLTLQKEEVCDAKLVSLEALDEIIGLGNFVENEMVIKTIRRVLENRKGQ